MFSSSSRVAKETGYKKTQRGNHGRRWSRGRLVQLRKSTAVERNDLLIAFGLVAVTLIVYAQVMSHQFIALDDNHYIPHNPMVNHGVTLGGIAWAFTTFDSGNWHPLTWFSHMLDSQIFGLNAGAHLLVNALIHASNALLVFLFLRRATGAKWQSAIVAALFALHPLHVESVAWAAERKDTLATFFGLLSLFAYVRYVETPSWKRYTFVSFALALGLMAKPMLVTWPFVLLLLDYWPLGRLQWQPSTGAGGFLRAVAPLVREKLPLFFLVGASAVITVIAQSYGGAVRTFADVPVSLRLANAVVSYAKYLFLTLWPSDLAMYYPFPRTGVPGWQLACALVLLAVITAWVLRQASERPYLLMGWLWFIGTLIPVIGLVQVGWAAMADRYFYIPSVGLFVAIVFGLSDLARALRVDRIVVSALTVAALLIMTWLTTVQIGRWRNSETLFQYTLSVTPDNRVIENMLGTVLGESGRYDEAAAHFAKAIRIEPDFFEALVNMGITLSQQGKSAEAVHFYDRALAVDPPTSARAHVQLAQALLQQDRKDDALRQLYRASELAPGDADIRTRLGLMLSRQGKGIEAVQQLDNVLRLNPDSAEAHNNLGVALLRLGRVEESIPHFSAALRLKPDLGVARDNLRRAQAQLNTRR